MKIELITHIEQIEWDSINTMKTINFHCLLNFVEFVISFYYFQLSRAKKNKIWTVFNNLQKLKVKSRWEIACYLKEYRKDEEISYENRVMNKT